MYKVDSETLQRCKRLLEKLVDEEQIELKQDIFEAETLILRLDSYIGSGGDK